MSPTQRVGFHPARATDILRHSEIHWPLSRWRHHGKAANADGFPFFQVQLVSQNPIRKSRRVLRGLTRGCERAAISQGRPVPVGLFGKRGSSKTEASRGLW
jgi:hypothetical protein